MSGYHPRTSEGFEALVPGPVRLPREPTDLGVGESRRVRQLRIGVSARRAIVHNLKVCGRDLEVFGRVDDDGSKQRELFRVARDDEGESAGFCSEGVVQTGQSRIVRVFGEAFFDEGREKLRQDGVAGRSVGERPAQRQ